MEEKLRTFLEKRDSLLQSRAKILEKIREIDHLLGSGGNLPVLEIGQRRRRPKNEMNLKDAIGKALADGPKNRNQILEAVQAMGYKFSTNNPLNSLSAALYTNKQFNKDGQIFSIKGTSAGKGKKKTVRKKG
ncbi:MAG: hypothetical protein HOH33_06185 [Verrucomicrobia bacterium]|jgi:hypothetical protein|nr:hypothetical protein [Verrucomicrobiota bacterium]